MTVTGVRSTSDIAVSGLPITGSTQTVDLNPDADPLARGDVTGDGTVDSGDAILVLRYSIGLTPPGDLQCQSGNVTGKSDDRDIDSGDAIKILRYSAGLITSLD